MLWPKTGETHYHEQFGQLDKGLGIKGLMVYYVMWIRSIKGMGLRTSARCLGLNTSLKILSA